MHPNKGPVTQTFAHAPGDRVKTAVGDIGIVEASILERGGNFYSIAITGGERAYNHEDDVTTRKEDDVE